MSSSDTAIARHMSRLGKSLAAQRLNRNQTQRDLAEAAGISLATLKRVENGENVSLDTLVRLLEALGMADRLGVLTPPADVRPIDRVRPVGTERKRAASRPHPDLKPSNWKWGDSR